MFVETKNIGLRNIEVADTKISAIDGINGKLIYRGYDILDLVKKSSYEETACMLLNDDLPSKTVLSEFSDKLIDARTVPDGLEKILKDIHKTTKPMIVLKFSFSVLHAIFIEKLYI